MRNPVFRSQNSAVCWIGCFPARRLRVQPRTSPAGAMANWSTVVPDVDSVSLSRPVTGSHSRIGSSPPLMSVFPSGV
jgi:hypothetical protein